MTEAGRESTTPLLAPVDGFRNVTDLLTRRAAAAPEHAAFDVATGGTWRPVSTREFESEVAALAKGLIAVGVRAGDAVAIMAPTRYEWALADLAAWFAGAVVVPIYDSSSPVQAAAIVADAGVVLGIGGESTHVDTLRNAFAETATGQLGVWAMAQTDAAASGTLTDLARLGDGVSDDELEERRTTAGPSDPATIVYTSGTTGEPKGAILTHRNFLGQVLNIAAAYREVVHPGGNTVIFLPLAHVLARGLQLICLASGMRIAHLSDTSAVVASLAELRPTFLVVVPRVLQKIQAAAAQKAADAHLGRVWRSAVTTAIAWGRYLEDRDAGGASRPPVALRARHALFDRLFFARLRTVMGGRIDDILSGGASLETDLSLFFRGIGVPIIEGYGLTETTAPLTGNLPGRIRSGTVGLPLPGSTVRIGADGEILARGIGVFEGYRNPAHNADAFVDGFFRTGDLGRIDDAGRLVLQGRVKDVIVTSNGKTIVPSAWEDAVEKSPLVAHAVMVGDDRSYLSALLLLDADETAAWARAHDVDLGDPPGAALDEIADPRLRAHLQTVVDAANARVARSEQVRRFALVSTDLADTALVTPTMKIKRRALLERGAATVDALYR